MIMIETPERSVTAQDVPRAVRKCDECLYKGPDGCSAWNCSFIDRDEAARAYTRTRWIPVEERLPETDEIVLVSGRNPNGTAEVLRAYHNGRNWIGAGVIIDVLAWMPEPEPYQARG